MIQLNINQNSYQAIIIKHENDLTVCEEHSHNFLELAYTVRGKAIHTLNGASSTISEGDYIITIPGDIHKYDKLGEENLEIINCIYTPDFSIDSKTLTPIDSILEDLNIDFDSLTHHPARYIFHDDSKTVLNILNIMENEYKNKNPKYKFILQKLFDAIFLYSLQSIMITHEHSANITEYIRDYVSIHYNEANILQTISEKTKYTIQYLSTKFKKDTGVNFKTFLQTTRIRAASLLLTDSNLQIPMISEAVGYHDTKYFTDTFKKIRGCTPTQYRSKHSVANKRNSQKSKIQVDSNPMYASFYNKN